MLTPQTRSQLCDPLLQCPVVRPPPTTPTESIALPTMSSRRTPAASGAQGPSCVSRKDLIRNKLLDWFPLVLGGQNIERIDQCDKNFFSNCSCGGAAVVVVVVAWPAGY